MNEPIQVNKSTQGSTALDEVAEVMSVIVNGILKIPYEIGKATFLSGTTYRQLREWNERNCVSAGDSLEMRLTITGFVWGILQALVLLIIMVGKRA